MTASKRKNEASSSFSTTTSRVFVGNSNNVNVNHSTSVSFDDGKKNDNQWVVNTMDRINQLRNKWQADQPNFGGSMTSASSSSPVSTSNYLDDPVALAIRSVNQGDTAPEQDLLAKATQVKAQLEHNIQQAKELCDQESTVLIQLASHLAKFQEQRKALLQQIDDLDEHQRASQQKIALYQEEASQELDVISDLEEEKKRQVPRLKASISLYAVTTGIKWDFEDPDILSGQVVSTLCLLVAAVQRIRRSINVPQTNRVKWFLALTLVQCLPSAGHSFAERIQAFLNRSARLLFRRNSRYVVGSHGRKKQALSKVTMVVEICIPSSAIDT